MIAEHLHTVRERIRTVCGRCGRSPEEIVLVAVSKTVSRERILEAYDAGVVDFGENYVQELQAKRSALIDLPVRWHVIGHLQTNKVKYVAGYAHLIHSVDGIDLAREISKRAENCGRVQDVLVEVHTTDETTKTGVRPEQTVDLVRQISRLRCIAVRGLMTMGPFSDHPEDSRPSFRRLAAIRDEIEREQWEHVSMQYLSMGMTHDFETAIEEGATMVRIGTAIFGERSYTE